VQLSDAAQMPSPQSGGQSPQSSGQDWHDSDPEHSPLPHPGQAPQSVRQLRHVSVASHVPLPHTSQGQSAGHIVHDSSKPQSPSPQTPWAPLTLAFEHPLPAAATTAARNTRAIPVILTDAFFMALSFACASDAAGRPSATFVSAFSS
jgi:hypothetical protein